MKEEFNREEDLMHLLNEYKVEIPEELSQYNHHRWQRFIEYLASPTQDPLEKLNASFIGYRAFRIIPIIGAIGITLLQLVLL